jgi:hypothetical protein
MKRLLVVNTALTVTSSLGCGVPVVPHLSLTHTSFSPLSPHSPHSATAAPLSPCEQETVTVDLYIIRKLGLMLKNFPSVGCLLRICVFLCLLSEEFPIPAKMLDA